jgi:hypothetical protein
LPLPTSRRELYSLPAMMSGRSACVVFVMSYSF